MVARKQIKTKSKKQSNTSTIKYI